MARCRLMKIICSVLPLWAVAQLIGAYAPCAELQGGVAPAITQKHIMKNAVRVQITPRGQQLFDTHLTDILGNLGVNINEGYFPTKSFSADKPLTPVDIGKLNTDAMKMFTQVRDLMTKWFVGFSLNDPRPAISIGDSGYTAQFTRLGLITDETLMSKLGKRDGAIMAIEMDVKKLNISSKAIRAWDMNNEFLGQVGMDGVSVQVASDAKPLKIRLPFYIRMNTSGGLDFEALDITQNIDQVDISVQYKNLVVPQISMVVNGKTFQVNNQEIEKLISDKMPDIITGLRGYLGDFAKKQLPDLLNQKAKEYLSGSLEQIQDMKAPGKDPGDTRVDFKWGLILSGIGLQKSLNVSLNAYAEDPLNNSVALVSSDMARGTPAFTAMTTDKYDIGLSLDRGVINRILRLSFLRKNFDKIPMNEGDPLKLMAAPTIDYIAPPSGLKIGAQEAFLKLHVSVQNDPNSSFLQKTIVLDFDIIAKLRQLPDKSGMQLVLQSIDTDSLSMDDKYFSWLGSALKGTVRKKIQDHLTEISAPWKTKDQTVRGTLPIPPQVLGLQLDVNKVLMDPTGNLVMYLNYAKTSILKINQGVSK